MALYIRHPARLRKLSVYDWIALLMSLSLIVAVTILSALPDRSKHHRDLSNTGSLAVK